MIEQQDLDIYDLMLANEHGEEESDSDSEDISGSALTTSTIIANTALNHLESEDGGVGSDSSFGRREKARRKMTTKEDLLFNDTDVPEPFSLPVALMTPPTPLAVPSSPLHSQQNIR